NIEVAALSETRLTDEGQLTKTSGGYTFFKGKEHGGKQSGVGFVIHTKLVSELDSIPKGISDQLMLMRILLKYNKQVTLVSAYIATKSCNTEDKETFYSDLHRIVSATPNAEKLIFMGTFSAWVGADYTVCNGVTGKHGVGSMNSNGLLLLSKCNKHQLTITDIISKEMTWMHPGSEHWHLIDYITVRQRDVQDVLCWMNHWLIRSKQFLVISPCCTVLV
uniref:Endonuclease/exonuclease/phosphatase domain-containing protein n=1 Tax=Latimeria chalumnae TaxID=7897 RepID=H3ADV5_LATCH